MENFQMKKYKIILSKNNNKYVDVNSADEYFLLPRKQREHYFMYKLPYSLPVKIGDLMGGEWSKFYKSIKRKYPIQYFFREVLFPFIERHYRNVRRALREIFTPANAEIRAKIPRHYCDIASLIEDINFQLIVSFKKEADNGMVDWNGTEGHKEFYNWLHETAKTVSQIPSMEDELLDFSNEEYKQKHEELEKLKEKILIEMVKYRHYFWT